MEYHPASELGTGTTIGRKRCNNETHRNGTHPGVDVAGVGVRRQRRRAPAPNSKRSRITARPT